MLKWSLHNIYLERRTGSMAIIALVERSQIDLMQQMQYHTIQYIAATLSHSRIFIRRELTVTLKVIAAPL